MAAMIRCIDTFATYDQLLSNAAQAVGLEAFPQSFGGSQIMTTIPTGRYRHYKGKEYEVIGVARHSETEEELVVYRTLYGNFDLWVRPLAMFLESVDVDGRAVARFQYIGDEANA